MPVLQWVRTRSGRSGHCGPQDVGGAAGGDPVGLLLLGEDGERLGEHGVRAVGQAGEHPVDGPAQVDRGRAAVDDPLRVPADGVLVDAAAGIDVVPGGKGDAERPGDPDDRRAADHQPADRVDDVVDRGQPQELQPCRQRGLVDGDDRAVVPVEGSLHAAIVRCATAPACRSGAGSVVGAPQAVRSPQLL